MIALAIFFIWFFGLLHSVFEYLNYKFQKEFEELERNEAEIKEAAITRECRRVRKFLNADGSVNTKACKSYLRRQEIKERKKPETILYLEVEG